MPDSENHYAHAPLPYVVVLRVGLGDDAPSERIEHHIVAYSAYEAVHAAIIEACGSFENGKIKVESLRPDVAAYWVMMVEKLAQAAKA